MGAADNEEVGEGEWSGNQFRWQETYRWIEGLRDCAEVSRSLDGVRVISIMDREADFFDLFVEQREHPEVDLLVRAMQDRVLERKTPGKKKKGSGQGKNRKLFGRMRSAPVRGRFRLKVSRLSRRIKASRQAARPGRAARVAEMELRYETLTIPAPLKTHAGVDLGVAA